MLNTSFFSHAQFQRTGFLLFGVWLMFLLVVAAHGQAVDDEYVVDVPQILPLQENDNPQGLGFYLLEVPEKGTLSNSCQGCTGGALFYTPTFTGLDTFKYCWGQLDWTGNIILCYQGRRATVTILNIGTDNSQNRGASCPLSVAKPVNVVNGNMWLQQSDYALPGVGDPIKIDRFYNSQGQLGGYFGYGWSTKYDESLTIYDVGMVRLNLPDGKGAFFGRPDSGVPFTAFSPEVAGQIVKETDNSYTLTFHDGRIHKFDTAGKLLWLRDRNGNQTTLGYTNGFLTSITDPSNRTLTLTPNPDGTTSQISDSSGIVASYEYFTGTTFLKTVTYPDGSKYKFEYDTTSAPGKTLLSTVKDALDNILETHQYDSQGRAITSQKQGGIENYTLDYSNSALASNPYTTVTDALGHVSSYYFQRKYGKDLLAQTIGSCSCGGSGSETTSYLYDGRLNLSSATDALGRITQYQYDDDRNIIKKIDPLGTQSWTYNSQGGVLTYKDRIDYGTATNTVANTYDSNGNLLTSTDGLNNTTTFAYTGIGQLHTITDALNHTTTLTYDNQGRMTQVTDANNKSTGIAYNARVLPTSVTNAINETTSFQYDLNNRLNKVIFPDANFITYGYDLAGRRTSFTDAGNHTTTYAYDGAYRLTGITDALSHTTTFGYDPMSNLTSRTDALGNVTNYEYDDFNRLKKITYPEATTGATRLFESLTYDTVGNVKTRVDTAGRTTSYDYDTSNRLIKITNALSKLTQFEYNARSQMTKVKDALNQEYTFTYDPLGRELTQTRAGTTMSFQYDAAGNRTQRTDYRGWVTNYTYDNLNRLTGYTDNSYTYDDLSRLVTATNNVGTVAFAYDNRGRQTSETDVWNHVIGYSYDAAGNRTALTLDGTNYAAYSYDNADRLTNINYAFDNTNVTYGYDIANRLTTRGYPNGVSTNYDYDGMSRLTRLKDFTSSSTLFDRQYSYNTANQISQIVEPTRTRGFTYDNIDRLTAVTDSLYGNESYAYDAVGNRTSSHLSSSYTYQPNNRLVTSSAGTNTYDANGNRTNGFAFWDNENRLGSLSDYVTSSYTYDALGRRVSSAATMPTNLGPPSTETQYTYEGQDVLLDDTYPVNNEIGLGEAMPLSSGGGGEPTPTPHTVNKYLNGPGIDNKLRQNTELNGSAISDEFFIADHLGSTNALTDLSGNIDSQAAYDSFGNQVSATNVVTRYQFTGRERDGDTGLYYYRARWYDPNLGRFISEDPIGFAGGDVNLYGYVWNRPIRLRDSRGLSGEEVLNDPNVLRGAAAALTAIAPFAPPVAVAAVGGAAIYGGWRLGEWTAEQPWNPFTHPWTSPHNPSFPNQSDSIPRFTSPTSAEPYCQPRSRPIPWTRDRTSPWPEDDDPDDRGCDIQHAKDQEVCSKIIDNSQMRGACYAHAFDRWASCKAGRNIPYNPWPDYPWD